MAAANKTISSDTKLLSISSVDTDGVPAVARQMTYIVFPFVPEK